MTRPLISDAAGAALSPLWLGEFPKNIGPVFRSEGAESKEVSGLPLEEVVVLEPVKTLVLRYNTSICDLLVCSEVRTWCAYQTLL